MTETHKEYSDQLRDLHAAYVAERLSLIHEFLDEHDDESEQLAMLSDDMDGEIADTLALSPWPSVRKALIDSAQNSCHVTALATVAAYPLGAGYDDRGGWGHEYKDDEYNDEHEHRAAGLVTSYAFNFDLITTLNCLVNGGWVQVRDAAIH